MPTSNPAPFAFSTTCSTGAAPESLTIRSETSGEWRSGETAAGRRSRTFPVARRASARRLPNVRNRGEVTAYRLEATTITSCLVAAAVRGNASTIASSAFVESGFPTTCEFELSPCSEVATSASAISTATPQSASVRRGRAAAPRASRSVKPMVEVLLHRDGLGEVPRLVDVEPAEPRDPVGEELKRDHGERCLEAVRRPRHVDNVVGVVRDVLVAVGRDRDHVGAAGAGLLDVRDDL